MKKIKVSFIGFSLVALGLRSISSYLKFHGYETRCCFFSDYGDKEINENLLGNMLSIIKDSDLIGISLVSLNYFDAIKLTKYFKKKLKVPIVWGGPHPISDPNGCIKHADIVCIGEGEETFLELVEKLERKESILDIPNLWIRNGTRVIKNPFAKLVTDLDKYPFPDYDVSNHYVYDKKLNLFKKMSYDDTFTNELIVYWKFKVYYFLSARGCPYNCTYCGNNILRSRYKGKYFRKRGISHGINELKWVKSKLGFINLIRFEDDTFTFRTEEEIIKFSKRYKKEVGLPFHIQIDPLTLNETKLKALLDCGLIMIKPGIQTGSERILKEVYKRPMSNETVLQTAHLLYKYRHKLMVGPLYSFMFDNPFEDIDDYVETLNLISKIPRPYRSLYHSLIFFKGTELYNRAKKTGYINDEDTQIRKNVRCGEFNYIRFFTTFYPLIPFWIPKKITKFLIKKRTIIFLQQKKFNKIFKVLTLTIFFIRSALWALGHEILQSELSIKGAKECFHEYILTRSLAKKV